MPIGLLYGLAAALCWGITDVCAALAGRRFGALLTVAAGQSVSLTLLVIIAFASVGHLPIDTRILLPVMGLGVVSGISYLTFFTALRLGPIAVVSPVVSAYGGLTVLLAVILLDERLSGGQALGAIVAMTGILLVGVRFESDWRRTRFVGPGVPFALVALVAFGFSTIGLTRPIHDAGWLPVVFASRLANCSTAWAAVTIARVVAGRRLQKGHRLVGAAAGLLDAELDVEATLVLGSVRPGVTLRGLAILGATGVLDLAGLLALAVGLEKAETWLVGLASSFGPAIAVLVAVVLLHERLRPMQWAGLATLGAGILLVSRG
jgi:drug/metabolite transporter (DMT)-like permease